MTRALGLTRARVGLTVAAVAAAVLVGGCSSPAAPPASTQYGIPATAMSITPPRSPATQSSGSPPPTATPPEAATSPAPTGDSWARPTLAAVPDPPRLTAEPSDFASPQAVAAAYLAAWCYAPADAPANTNLAHTAPWVTAAGWADDQTRAVDDPTWARTRAAGVSTICGPAAAADLPQGPTSGTEAWVGVSAQQARIRNGAVIGQSPVSMVRRVLRADDGRWLVDVRVMAG